MRKRIIENWEAQDEPEHLKTIRDRVSLERASALGKKNPEFCNRCWSADNWK